MRGRSRWIADLVGLAIAGSLALLAFVRTPGETEPSTALLVAAAVGSVVVARLLGAIWRGAVPLIVAVAGVAVALSDGIGGGPLSGPFGYRNATGAFLALAAIAVLMLAASLRDARSKAIAVFVGLAVAGWLVYAAIGEAAAASIAIVAVAPALLALAGRSGARASVILSGIGFVVMVAGTIALGGAYDGDSSSLPARALTERRLVLWNESLDLLAAEPGGAGSGRFAEVSPTAIRDADARWAHHEFLEQGVELGWVGLALTVALFLWGFVRLWMHPVPDAFVALGASALAAGGSLAAVDYVLHFPAIALALAGLVGSAQAEPFRRFARVDDDARQEGDEVGGAPAGAARPARTG
jgi:hypothetical protein